MSRRFWFFAAVVAFAAASVVPLAAQGMDIPKSLVKFSNETLAAIGKDPQLVGVRRDEQREPAGRGEAEGARREVAEEGRDRGFREGAARQPVSARLAKVIAGYKYIPEAFIMDAQGTIVGETNRTSTYWKGEQAKFTARLQGRRRRDLVRQARVRREHEVEPRADLGPRDEGRQGDRRHLLRHQRRRVGEALGRTGPLARRSSRGTGVLARDQIDQHERPFLVVVGDHEIRQLVVVARVVEPRGEAPVLLLAAARGAARPAAAARRRCAPGCCASRRRSPASSCAPGSRGRRCTAGPGWPCSAAVSSAAQASGMMSERSRRVSPTDRMNFPDPSIMPPTMSDQNLDCTMLGMKQEVAAAGRRGWRTATRGWCGRSWPPSRPSRIPAACCASSGTGRSRRR